MRRSKATHAQLRQRNRQLLLRAVYSGTARSRTELALQTDLAKSTISEVIGELVEEGYLIESGFGQSTDEGGKRPRLLEFVPQARHVIGLSIDTDRIVGLLADLDGRVNVEHHRQLYGSQRQDVINALIEVVNGLLAQMSAPLLCIGVGIWGTVDTAAGVVQSAPYLDWQAVPLAEILTERFRVPVYLANSTELAALGQFAFREVPDVKSLCTVFINDGVGVGLVLDGGIFHSGAELGQMHSGDSTLEKRLGWPHVRGQLAWLQQKYVSRHLPDDRLSYVHLQQAIFDHDPRALAIRDELADHLAQIFTWVVMLIRPDHLSLAGEIADLGQELLDITLEKAQRIIPAKVLAAITFSTQVDQNLVAVGALAKTLQQELGIV